MVNDLHMSHWILMIALLWSYPAQAAFTAQVDRYNISMDESINLTIEVSGDDSGEPDFAPLQSDFDILSRNKSSSYSLINGSMSSKSTWFLSLRPRHTGALTIPALSAGHKKTTAIIIQVSKPATRQTASSGDPHGELWIDMSAEPSTVHVQQQSIITLRIYQAISLNQAQLTEPLSDHALVVRLGKDKNYQVQRNNKNWAVTERRYAIFPQQQGKLKLEPVQLDGSIVSGASYGSLFQSTKPIRVRSNALEITVEPIVANWKGSSWLPAKHVELVEDWPNGEFHVGDAITRTITLKADGLHSSQLPELSSSVLPDHLKAYADKAVLSDSIDANGIVGSRQEKLAILATRPGSFVLPGIDVSWWNSSSQKMQIASLPARTFKILAALENQNNATNQTSAIPSQQTTQTQLPAAQSSRIKQPADATWWKWLALFSSLGWLFTVIYLWRQSTHHQQTRRATAISIKDLKQAVHQACSDQQSKACAQALLKLANAQWPDENIHNLAAMAEHCDSPLAQQIKALELHLYGKQAKQPWQSNALQRAFEQAVFASVEAATPKGKALPALYPE